MLELDAFPEDDADTDLVELEILADKEVEIDRELEVD